MGFISLPPWWAFLGGAFAIMVGISTWLAGQPPPGGGKRGFTWRPTWTWEPPPPPAAPSLATAPQPPPPPPLPGTEAEACREGESRTEIRHEVETDIHDLGRMLLRTGHEPEMEDSQREAWLHPLKHGRWVVDLTGRPGGLDQPLALGAWIMASAGFPDPDDIMAPPDGCDLAELPGMIRAARTERRWGQWTLICPRTHVRARCEVTRRCLEGNWVTVRETLVMVALTADEVASHSPAPIEGWAAGRRALIRMARELRAANRTAKAALERCATRGRDPEESPGG